MADEMEIQLARLTAVVDQGFKSLDARLIAQQEGQSERHRQNLVRLDAINGKVGRAHERIAEHQSWLAAMESEFRSLRDRFNAFMDGRQSAAPSSDESDRQDKRILFYFNWSAGIVAGLVGLYKFIIWVLAQKGH